MEVTLQRPHLHAGQQQQPGDVIDVAPDTAQWLAEQGVIACPEPGRRAPLPVAATPATKKKGS